MNHKGGHKGCYILHKGYYMIFTEGSQYFVSLLHYLYDIIKDAIFRKILSSILSFGMMMPV